MLRFFVFSTLLYFRVFFFCISAECASGFFVWQDWQRNAPQKKTLVTKKWVQLDKKKRWGLASSAVATIHLIGAPAHEGDPPIAAEDSSPEWLQPFCMRKN